MANVYKFSSDQINIFLILLDRSSSMEAHASGVRKGLKMYQESFDGFPQIDSIAVSISQFGNEFYANDFRKIEDIETEYYARNEATALYYSIVKAAQYLKDYVQEVTRRTGTAPRATFVLFSDGEPCHDKMDRYNAKQEIESLNYAGITTAFIAFGSGIYSEFGKELGFLSTIDVNDESTVTQFLGVELSNSCKEQSKSAKALGADFFSKAAGEDSSGYSNTAAQALEDDSWLDDI